MSAAKADLSDVHTWLTEALPELLTEHDVPAAAVGVLHHGHSTCIADGVLNRDTEMGATPDSVFQIGSITKLWTTSLLLQLVQEGLLDLDAPVGRYLPVSSAAGDLVAPRVTTRHLLTHTAGLDGDVFTPTTTGADATKRYVTEVLPGVQQVFEPGQMYSYCNSGFVLAGRIVEVLRGQPFGSALHEHLAEPLGLARVSTRAEEAILHRAAVGHIRPAPREQLRPAPVWSLPHSTEAAGAMLAMSATDLLGFAEMFLTGGQATNGTPVLDPSSIEASWHAQVSVPQLGTVRTRRGLGWVDYGWPGQQVWGHDGATIGQGASLRVLAEHQLAVVVLTNGGRSGLLTQAVLARVAGQLAGAQVPALPTPPLQARPGAQVARCVGTYETHSVRLAVQADEQDRVWLTRTPLGELAEQMDREPVRTELRALDAERFITVDAEEGAHQVIAFTGTDDAGRAAFAHTGRAVPRCAEPR